MRRALLLLSTMSLVLLLSSGVALALHLVICPSSGGDCEGTIRSDQIQDSDQDDTIYAKAGKDVAVASSGADKLYGGAGADVLAGGQGNDEVYGKAGGDGMHGDGDADLLVGGRGNDNIDATESGSASPGKDTVSGEGGDDEITANDDVYDYIDCGEGNDTVYYDDHIGANGEVVDEVAANCETTYSF
jgi:Ca2+-binding RTX toxin-like protein